MTRQACSDFTDEFVGRAPGFALRRATSDDAAFLRRLFLATQPVALPETLLDLQYTSQSSTYAALHPDAMHSVVERDGAPIGRVMIDWTGADHCHLIDLAILPDERAGAAGLHLLRAWVATVDRRGARATLMVRPDAPVTALYRRLGFVVVVADQFPIRMERRPSATSWRLLPRVKDDNPKRAYMG